jgi:hypothetical protein
MSKAPDCRGAAVEVEVDREGARWLPRSGTFATVQN